MQYAVCSIKYTAAFSAGPVAPVATSVPVAAAAVAASAVAASAAAAVAAAAATAACEHHHRNTRASIYFTLYNL